MMMLRSSSAVSAGTPVRAPPGSSQCRGPRDSIRRVVSCSAGPQAPLSVDPSASCARRSLLRSLCRAVEVEGQVARYETFAGRSAMLGIASAAFVELATDQGVVGAFSGDSALAYFATAGAVVAGAGVLALTRSNADSALEGGMELLEAVYASLTAVRRSASSLSQALEVDTAVDGLLEAVLDTRFDNFKIEALLSSSSDDEY